MLDPLVDHLGVPASDVVHHAADGLLVAGDFPGREHDDVVGLEAHVAVIVDGDPRQRGLRLALRARANADDILRRRVANFRVAHLHADRDPQISKPLRNLRVLDDPSSDERDPAIELRREIHQDLHPVR